jgi:hypothetical protein
MGPATNPQATIAVLETRTMAKKHYLTATLPDGYVKTIGPTALDFTHYWRIVAQLGNGRTEVFWGHAKSLAEARKKHTAARDAAAQRGWADYVFEVVELVRTTA